ncbi:S8 family serine peptidase, partial [Mycoplasmopsis agassizii]
EKNKDISPITKQYILQNQNFVNSLEGSLSDLSFYTISKTTPYINFVFKNRKNLETNLFLLAGKENSVSINSYEDASWKPQAKINQEKSSKLDFQYNYDVFKFEKQFELVGALEQRKKDALFKKLLKEKVIDTEIKKIKLGIYEATGSVSKNNILFSDQNIHYYKEGGKEQYNITNEKYTDKLLSVIAGKNGVDLFVDDIYSVYDHKDNAEWQKFVDRNAVMSQKIAKYDWLISSGVKVINNSWDQTFTRDSAEKHNYGYNYDAYYYDFIARKYGIINVFHSGSSRDEGDYVIALGKLSHNSVIVGSSNLSGDKLSDFSEYRTSDKNIITKPLIVAPGEIYHFESFVNDNESITASGNLRGSWFSAALVSGLITMLLRNNYNLVGRPEAVLAILTAGSRKIEGYGPNNPNSLNNQVGAGLVNYELMQKAANNIQNINVSESNRKQEIALPNLEKGQTLSISTAWLFDAGYSTNREYRPSLPETPGEKPKWDKRWDSMVSTNTYSSYTQHMYNIYDGLHAQKMKEWNKKSKVYEQALEVQRNFDKNHSRYANGKYESEWKSIDYLKEKYGENWYIPTDIDLKVEKLNESNGEWEIVGNSASYTSNIEFIRIQIKESGKYRAVIRQYGQTRGETSTKGVMTYVIS